MKKGRRGDLVALVLGLLMFLAAFVGVARGWFAR
jgi:hypothetical protein